MTTYHITQALVCLRAHPKTISYQKQCATVRPASSRHRRGKNTPSYKNRMDWRRHGNHVDTHTTRHMVAGARVCAVNRSSAHAHICEAAAPTSAWHWRRRRRRLVWGPGDARARLKKIYDKARLYVILGVIMRGWVVVAAENSVYERRRRRRRRQRHPCTGVLMNIFLYSSIYSFWPQFL